MRQIKATAKAVQKARRDWYTFHYDNRQQAKILSHDQLERYQYAASMIEAARMTIYGGVPGDFPERQAYEIATRYRLDVNLINHWYLSEAGWEEFQRLWRELPEPVDLYQSETVHTPCVQIGELYTLSTMGADAEPPK